MALVLPLFLFITLAVVDMGRVFASYIALTDGVREAALYASEGTNNTKWCAVPDPDPDAANVPCPSPDPDPTLHQNTDPYSVDNIAYQLEATGLDASDVQLDPPGCTDVCDPVLDGTVRIRATYDVELLIPMLGDLMGGPVTLSATTTARVLP